MAVSDSPPSSSWSGSLIDAERDGLPTIRYRLTGPELSELAAKALDRLRANL
jgi:hypothetical protein